MNELPVTGSLCLRTDFWDRHVANFATHLKDVWQRLLRRQKKKIKEIDYYTDTREAQVFVEKSRNM